MLELALLNAIISGRREGSMEEALRLGVSLKLFSSNEAQQLWQYMLDHYKSDEHYKAVPSRELIEHRFPGLDLPSFDDSLASLAARLRADYNQHQALTAAERLLDELSKDEQTDVPTLVAKFNNSLNLAADAKAGHSLASALDLIKQHTFSRLMGEEEALGFPMMWPFLNKRSPGFTDEDVFICAARPGIGKTWLLFHALVNIIESSDAILRALIVRCDMSESSFTNALSTTLARLPAGCIADVNLSSTQMDNWYDRSVLNLEAYLEAGGALNVINGIDLTPDDVARAAEEMNANFVAIDGAYNLTDQRSGRASRDFKVQDGLWEDIKLRIAHKLKVPVLCTTQGNRQADDRSGRRLLKDLGFTDSIGREASFVMFVNDSDPEKGEPPDQRRLSFVKVRSLRGGFASIDDRIINFRPGHDFSDKGKHLWEKGGSSVSSRVGGRALGVDGDDGPKATGAIFKTKEDGSIVVRDEFYHSVDGDDSE